MNEQLRHHRPSPAMVVAVVALVLAATGTAIAASRLVNGDKLIAKTSLSGNRLRNHTLGKAQIDLTKLGTVLSAKTAANAGFASNAYALGGIPASGYTRNDCGSLSGQVKGWVSVQGSPSFPSSFVDVGGYNCSGKALQARRIMTGLYEVRFVQSPVRLVVGMGAQDSGGLYPNADVVNAVSIDAGDFRVSVYNPPTSKVVDDTFVLLAP